MCRRGERERERERGERERERERERETEREISVDAHCIIIVDTIKCKWEGFFFFAISCFPSASACFRHAFNVLSLTISS